MQDALPEPTDAAQLTPLSLDWESCLLAFRLPFPSVVEVGSIVPDRRLLVRTSEANPFGRVVLEGLVPATSYILEIRWDGGAGRLAFKTLPAPRGARRSQFVAMADPHVSEKAENRKGRLLVESRSILRELVEEWNSLGVDGVLAAGDLTNAGTAREFAWAQEILAGLRCPCFAAPGDHDIRRGACSSWQTSLGATCGISRLNGLCIITLNTAGGLLGSEGCRLIEEAIRADARALALVSHLQLIPDSFIRHGKQKVVRDGEEHRNLIRSLCERPTLVYAGHQNVPSLLRMGSLMQLNLPQPVQYPCGYVLVREYDNGFYHTYRPIRSETLNEYSRVEGNAAALRCHEPQWREDYRRGGGFNHLNFVFRGGADNDGDKP